MATIHNKVIYASFDPKPFRDPESIYYNITSTKETLGLNMAPSTISYQISSGSPIRDTDVLKFSSNGVIGLSKPLTAFEIPKINFVGQDIYFVATVTSLSSLSGDTYIKDELVPRKNYPKLDSEIVLLIAAQNNAGEDEFIITSNENKILTELSLLSVRLVLSDDTVVPTSSANFVTNYGPNSADFGGGYLRGIMKSSLSALDARILIEYATDSESISGYSQPFDIYPNKGLYDVRKIGENHNQTQGYKNLIFQEILNNKPEFFDKFLGQIVGNNKSSPDTLGIKTYAKVKNFVSNISDIEYADVNSLKSLIKELNITYEAYNQDFPPSLNRLIDIFSVSLSLQKGGKNQYQDNFDDRGFTGKDVYGKNKGSVLNMEDTILETGENSSDIIAYEKFSEQYKLVNTNILSSTKVEYLSSSPNTPGVSAYPLSSFNDTWGWGLVLPNGVEGLAVKDYYQFYNFIPGIEGSYLQEFIDFDNPINTYLEPSPLPFDWEGEYQTSNPPGGPPWKFNGYDTFVNLNNSSLSSKYYFHSNDWTIEMRVDLTQPTSATKDPELNTYDEAIIGQWSIASFGYPTPTEPSGNTKNRSWICLMPDDKDELNFQFSNDGETHTSTYSWNISANERTMVDLRFEKTGTNLKCFINNIEKDVTGGFGGVITERAPSIMFPSNMPIYIGGDSVANPNRRNYRYSGTVESLKITNGNTVVIDVSPSTSTTRSLTSYDQYAGKFGIVENILSHNLYSNLGLLSGT